MVDNPLKAMAESAKLVEQPLKIMAVDDEEFNLEILIKHLEGAGYQTISFGSGDDAWFHLQKNPTDVDIILLDKMMPGMSGLEVLKKIKEHPELDHITVILQTASVGAQEVAEGIEAGAYYYLTKPYAAEVLLSIVNAAAEDYKQRNYLKSEVEKKDTVLQITKKSEFELRTIDEARALSSYLSSFFADPPRVLVGLSALIINAIEHGNLGIGYEKKSELVSNNTLEKEVERLLRVPENQDKKIQVTLEKEGSKVIIHIKDQGEGFDWKEYLDFDPSRMTDPNGRGIAMAHIMSPGTIEFLNKGNEVLYTIDLEKEKEEAESRGESQ